MLYTKVIFIYLTFYFLDMVDILKDAMNKLDSFIYNYIFDTYPLMSNTDDEILFKSIKDDIFDYINFMLRGDKIIDELYIEFLTRNLFNMSILNNEEYNITSIQQRKYMRMAKKFIKEFIDNWWEKWLIRGKVIFNNQQLNEEQITQINESEDKWDYIDYLEEPKMNEMCNYTADLLIAYGEICFIEYMAENIVVKCLASLSPEYNEKELLNKINNEVVELINGNRKIYIVINISTNDAEIYT